MRRIVQIKFVMEALLVLLDLRGGDSWAMVKRLMHDASRFIGMLLSLDKDSLSSRHCNTATVQCTNVPMLLLSLDSK